MSVRDGMQVQYHYPTGGRGENPVQVVRAGVAVLVRNAELALLLGLRKGGRGAGTWGVPGGALEVGESVIECASRELREKTGLVVEPPHVRELGIYMLNHFEGGSWVTLWCIAYPKVASVEVREPEKFEEWRWVHSLPGPAFAPFGAFLARENPWVIV